MENKLPRKYEGGFWCKVKGFFSSLFMKKGKVNASVERENSKRESVKVEKNEFEMMWENSKKAQAKEDILEMIEKRPDMIEKLSYERLKELSKMYDEIIEENVRKIKKLERAVN